MRVEHKAADPDQRRYITVTSPLPVHGVEHKAVDPDKRQSKELKDRPGRRCLLLLPVPVTVRDRGCNRM